VGAAPCGVLELELALDRVEGELAIELPSHMRAFAHAHADGRPPPPAPAIARSPSTLELARRAAASELLADRGLALLRLVAPIAIEDDPAVVAARASTPSWAGLQRLAAARDAAAERRFGMRAIELIHVLHGSDAPLPGRPHDAAQVGPAIEGWHAHEALIDASGVVEAWQAIAARLGVTGSVHVDYGGPHARPRAFVVEPRREVIVVVPEVVDTPAARFAVLHELGHAVVAHAMDPGVPRAVDEAAASYVARMCEPPSVLAPAWQSALAARARARRLAIAIMLDELERGLPELAHVPGTTPPWALWHDPGAQAAYVAAEALADRITTELGPRPPRGQLVRALAAECDRIAKSGFARPRRTPRGVGR
jgi:hypothetical protein